MKYEIKAIYQFIHNYDLTEYKTREENGMTFIEFQSTIELGDFVRKHELDLVNIGNMGVIALVNKEENIYGQIVNRDVPKEIG